MRQAAILHAETQVCNKLPSSMQISVWPGAHKCQVRDTLTTDVDLLCSQGNLFWFRHTHTHLKKYESWGFFCSCTGMHWIWVAANILINLLCTTGRPQKARHAGMRVKTSEKSQGSYACIM